MTFFKSAPNFSWLITTTHGFCAPLYQINQRNSSFCAPFTNCTQQISIFPPSLRNIYPNFHELLWNSLKNTFLVFGHRFCAPLALRPRTTVPLPPPHATGSASSIDVGAEWMRNNNNINNNKGALGLLRSDGKRPDGTKLVPRAAGKYITWDVSNVHACVTSYPSNTDDRRGLATITDQIIWTPFNHRHLCPLNLDHKDQSISWVLSLSLRLRRY